MQRDVEQPRDEVNAPDSVTRREFSRILGAAAVAGSTIPLLGNPAVAAPEKKDAPKPESLVAKLHASLSDEQREKICFDWDHQRNGAAYRTHVDNNWQITEPKIASSFFTADQQDMIEALFWGLYDREWHDRIKRQLRDDAGGYGKQQSIAIFGEPGTGKYQFAMTGRHLTIRCDGDSAEHVAFGGPIFYGHAAQGFNEKPDHPGNVYWPAAKQANALFEMLDGKQRDRALVKTAPLEWDVDFKKPTRRSEIDGVPVGELSKDQREHVQGVLKTLLSPYRTSDRDEVVACLEKQGGLDACRLAFYREDDIGDDGVWDNWRLEGPSFVWYFRGAPHVHVWVNVASDSSVTVDAG